jgi:hypothetical protein
MNIEDSTNVYEDIVNELWKINSYSKW